MNNPDYSISTPENVDLHLELAGLGNRVYACLIDTLITYALCAGIWVIVWAISVGLGMALKGQASAVAVGITVLVGLLASFFIMFGYYIVFEGFWAGQTPGKKLAQIRVIDSTGQPVTWFGVWGRNLMRIIDMGLMFIGLIVMIVDKNERRLGDFAAGTLVIRERLPNLTTSDIKVSPGAKESMEAIDIGRVTPQEYDLLISFLKRREKMARSQRPLVAKELEKHFRTTLGSDTISSDNSELYLERIYAAYQSRAE
jgi:uncharacterized RDD family membrane protein YckC